MAMPPSISATAARTSTVSARTPKSSPRLLTRMSPICRIKSPIYVVSAVLGLLNRQLSDHSSVLVARNIAIEVVGPSRGIDDDLARFTRIQGDRDVQRIDRKVMDGCALVLQLDEHMLIGRNRQ